MKYPLMISGAAFILLGALVPACSKNDSSGDGDGDGDVGDGDGDVGDGDGDTSSGGSTGSGGTTGSGGAMGGMGGTGLGGFGGVPAMCGGDAVACDTYTTSSNCIAQDGCATSGTCSDPGGGTDCDEQFNQTDCEDNSCEWNYPCAPSPGVDCADLMSSIACAVQVGVCEWNTENMECQDRTTGGCMDADTNIECASLGGCTWTQGDFSCGGTATACSSVDAEACDAQEGCSIQ